MFIPHTDQERKMMLQEIGADQLADLFNDIPSDFRFPDLDLPQAHSEMEASQQASALADANDNCEELICFLGAGAYHHYVPAAVDMLLKRGEFFTAYTPYQPEISQGTLQAIFEYQSLISNLTGLPISNASHYDGATAAAEACLSAYHHFKGKRRKILISETLHPHYIQTIKTYLSGFDDAEISIVSGFEFSNQFAIFKEKIDLDTSLVFVQYPDFLGNVNDYTALSKLVHEMGSLLAVAVNPIALGLLKPPSEFSADFAVGEGQPLGIPLNFGGPYLGFFTTTDELVRRVSGRIAGETTDQSGNRGYVLTLTAREQHIRRGKATSNICTNQGLMALASAIYMSLLGKAGLRKVAELCFHRAHYAADEINKISGYEVINKGLFFNEILVKCPKPVEEINAFLLEQGVLGGFNITEVFPSLENHMLIAFTEMNSKEEIDLLVQLLSEVNHD